MTTFRYVSIWQVRTGAGLRYRVVTDTNGLAPMTLGDIRTVVLRAFLGFGESVDTIDLRSGGNRYVADSKLHPVNQSVTLQAIA